MVVAIILLMVKESPRIIVSVLIANIRSQFNYTPLYCKVWIAKQKALNNMQNGWVTSYNEVWQWYQVLERHVLGYVTDLETGPLYYNDRLLCGCRVFH
ncbi:hypothetical protein J1N35_037722, partial [Gossypium stocksii]